MSPILNRQVSTQEEPMKTRAIILSTLALAFAGASTASADDPSEDAKCHGQNATYVGTGGDDVISDETEDYGRNPVFVLGDGDDELQMGLGYGARLDSLTVCGGSGDDTIEIYQWVGEHSEILLDGGLDDDFVGNNGDLKFSDLARLTLIGSDGDDVLRGGNSNDSIVGGRGDDTGLRARRHRPDRRRQRRGPAARTARQRPARRRERKRLPRRRHARVPRRQGHRQRRRQQGPLRGRDQAPLRAVRRRRPVLLQGLPAKLPAIAAFTYLNGPAGL